MSLGEEYIRVQTCMLRVSVHCDDCRRKVENRLRGIDGVYVVRVDPGYGVVTVRVTMSPELSPDVIMRKIKSRKGTFVQLVAPFELPPTAHGGLEAKGVSVLPSVVVIGEKNVSPQPTLHPPSVTSSPDRHPVAESEEEDEDEEGEEGDNDEERKEEESKEDEEEDVFPIENLVLPLPVVNGRGGSRTPSSVVNGGVNPLDGPKNCPRSFSRPAHIGGVNPSLPGGNQIGKSGGQNMQGIYMGQPMGPALPSHNLPPRPTYVDPASCFPGGNLHPVNSYMQQLAGTPSYREPPRLAYQYPSYHYSAPASTQKEAIDGLTYKFNDENTGSCIVM